MFIITKEYVIFFEELIIYVIFKWTPLEVTFNLLAIRYVKHFTQVLELSYDYKNYFTLYTFLVMPFSSPFYTMKC